MAQPIELKEMTIEEKLQMMEALWDDLSRNAGDIESPAWHGDVLESREGALESGDQVFEDWQQARSKINSETN